MLLTKKSALQKLGVLIKLHPNSIVTLEVNYDEQNDPAISIQDKASVVKKWLGKQDTIFSWDELGLHLEAEPAEFDKDSVKFQVRYIYIPHNLPKIHSFEMPSEAVDFYERMAKSIYTANVEADFDVNKFLEIEE